MRTARVKEQGPAFYHVVSRVVDRQMVFDATEKEHCRRLLRAVEGFSAVDILTWTVLDNHFHILLHVPPRQEPEDAELLRRMALLYAPRTVQRVAQRLRHLRETGEEQQAEQIRTRYLCRMYELSQFVKTFKQRLTQSYNRRHGRKGTLWEERFKSQLLEGHGNTLSMVASYIDLNAVRAGLTDDPKDYRFCGYAEAVGGMSRAQAGLAVALGREGSEWEQTGCLYRQLLYRRGQACGQDETGEPLRKGFSPEQVVQVLAQGGVVDREELLRCRVRYLTEGAALGSRRFVEEVFQRFRGCFAPTRTTGACGLRGGAAVWGELYTAQCLRREPISPPVRG